MPKQVFNNIEYGTVNKLNTYYNRKMQIENYTTDYRIT